MLVVTLGSSSPVQDLPGLWNLESGFESIPRHVVKSQNYPSFHFPTFLLSSDHVYVYLFIYSFVMDRLLPSRFFITCTVTMGSFMLPHRSDNKTFLLLLLLIFLFHLLTNNALIFIYRVHWRSANFHLCYHMTTIGQYKRSLSACNLITFTYNSIGSLSTVSSKHIFVFW